MKSIDLMLEEMEQYGCPSVYCNRGILNSKGKKLWSCRLDVDVTTKGTSMEIKSDMGCTTAQEAVSQCYNRMLDMHRDLSQKQLRDE